MIRRLTILVAWLLVCAAPLAAQEPPKQPEKPQAPEQKAPAFRVSVDVVPVDVQVIDKNGRPVLDLGPEKFTVTISGKRRRVVSAERIGSSGEPGAVTTSSGPSISSAGRVFMLAVDCISFDATASRGVIQATRQFIQRLQPEDFVGLHAYPNGPKLDPTLDHAAIIRALEMVAGQGELADLRQFHVRPTEIIDMTRELSRGGGPTVESVVTRECGEPADPFCRSRLITDVSGTALYYEGQATASLGMLRTLISSMGAFNGRKTLVLVSGGMVASDSPGGRPDLMDLGIQVGKEAAVANTTIYTLYLDINYMQRFAAQTRAGDRNMDNWSRDSIVLGRWLEQFSGAAGGALFNIQVGNAEPALDRILNEMSSYYLLGVEPADADRDGRTHEVAVKTTESKVTVRGRRWVTIPKRNTIASSTSSSGPADPPPTPGRTAPAAKAPEPASRRVPPPSDVQTLADMFDRGNFDGMQKSMAENRDLANLIRGFRMSDSPWPNDTKRSAVFALEMALAGLRSNNGFARDEGGRLLAEYHARVRQPDAADPFECWWFVTESAALEGLFMPESALLFIPRAIQRCPAEARLHLAYAFVYEQEWLRGGMTPAQEEEIVTRYEEAMKFPDVEPEARVRAARFLYGLGKFDRALALLDARPPATDKTDQELRYLGELFRGQILRAMGRSDDAVAAFRSALSTWPGAQSARVALMTLLLNRGESQEASTLADAVQTAGDDQFDPWWTYYLGDYRAYHVILGRLREMGK